MPKFSGLLAISAAVLPVVVMAAGTTESFDVLEYRVLNNTLLNSREVEQAVYQYLGEHKTMEDVQAARASLEDVYRKAGYNTVFVDIPEQDVADSVVRLKVTEGKLGKLKVSGARYFANGRIRSELPSLQSAAVPQFTEVQRDLQAANQLSRDLRITPILRAGRVPGTVDMELKVNDTLPLHGGIEVNDKHSADTSATRVTATVSYDNLWQHFHSLSLQYQTAPEEPKEARVFAATYTLPLAKPGEALAFYAVDTNSDVAAFGTLSVLGKGRIYGARWVEPLPAGANYFHGLSFGMDYKSFDESVLVSPALGLQTPISYLNNSLGYTGSLHSGAANTTFDLTGNFGVRGLANSTAEFEGKRFKAPPNYFYLRANVRYERPLFAPLAILARASGMYSATPLIGNEQFAIGGADSVRGYLEAEELGDYGVNGTLELHAGYVPPAWRTAVNSFYVLAFYDVGAISVLEPLGQANHADLSSWGLGLRFLGFHGLEAGLDWAQPLVSTTRTEAGESRLHFRMNYNF